MAIGTGHGASITFGTTSFSAAFTSIGGSETTIDEIEDFDLSTTGHKTVRPSDLTDPGEFTVPFYCDGEDGYPAVGTVETITVTYAQQTGETAAATDVGTGFIKRVKKADHSTGEMMAGELTVRWDGKTGPAFTAATTV
jgi:hypothetical protein